MLDVEFDKGAPGTTGRKTYDVRGYAYAGGGRRISRVEISLDNGVTWALADM